MPYLVLCDQSHLFALSVEAGFPGLPFGRVQKLWVVVNFDWFFGC